MPTLCPDDGSCTCDCHGPRTLGELAGMARPPWEDCCGPGLTWGLTWPDPPTSLDDWPTCWCGSGLLATSFGGDPAIAPQVILYSSRCCLGWSLRADRGDRHKDGAIGTLPGWAEPLHRIGGYRTLHAINRGEQPPEPDRHEVRLADGTAQPALF
ncbi:hypothetical protein [Nesterenkonia sp. HG001]|uniref:hypothetical protein n=1 Tax=Nesterenkonia sp. HG001 TaxID=2983207 RepID=UPI002AC647EC|nr:hypothetical protein [Nesterenkonia sp. HG001]MDZ5076756.1 hypothetical protein [Nesterenkonia sp. HG001]